MPVSQRLTAPKGRASIGVLSVIAPLLQDRDAVVALLTQRSAYPRIYQKSARNQTRRAEESPRMGPCRITGMIHHLCDEWSSAGTPHAQRSLQSVFVAIVGNEV
jgi:hypothetical protein